MTMKKGPPRGKETRAARKVGESATCVADPAMPPESPTAAVAVTSAGEHCVVPYNPAGSSAGKAMSPLDAKLRALESHVIVRRGKVIQGQIDLAELSESTRRLQEEADAKLAQLRAAYRRKSEDLTDEKARLEAEEALLKVLKE